MRVSYLSLMLRRRRISSKEKHPSSSEDRKGIERRSHSFLDPQRRGHKQKFVAIQTLRLLGYSLEIEIVKDAHAHGHERQLMQSQADRLGQARRRDIIRPITSDERDTSLFDEVGNVGVITGEARRVWPSAQRGAPFPAARIEQDDVAGRNFDALDFLQRFEVLPVNRCTGLQPTLRRGLSRQECGIEQNAARDDAVFEGIDTSSRTTARGLDLIHRYAVITLAVGHDVTIHRIEMAVNNAVIAAAILVTIQSDTRADINDGAFQNRRGIDGTLLNDIVGQRYRNSVLRERQRLLALGRRNQVCSAEFIFFPPASPIGKLLHGPPEIRVGCDFGVCIALSAGSVDKQHDDQRDSNQSTEQASNSEIHSVLQSRIPRDYNICSRARIPLSLRGGEWFCSTSPYFG